MTTLPACLPAAIAASTLAAGVCAVLVPVGAWIDWRDRRAAARTDRNSPEKAPGGP